MRTRNALSDGGSDWFSRLQELFETLVRGRMAPEEFDREVEAMKEAAAAEGARLDVALAHAEWEWDLGNEHPDVRGARRRDSPRRERR
jgi:hypothetical protein